MTTPRRNTASPISSLRKAALLRDAVMQLSSMPRHMDKRGNQRIRHSGTMNNTAHIVQFFRSDEEYVRAAGCFLREGLLAGETCMAVATAEHHRKLDRHLRDADLDPQTLSA